MVQFFSKLFKFFRRLCKALFSRTIIIGLGIILQIVWLWIVLEVLTGVNTVVYLVTSVTLGVILCLVIVNKDEVAEYKLPWILVTALFPLLAAVLYFFFGNTKPSKKFQRRFQSSLQHFEEFFAQNRSVLSQLKAEDPVAASQAQYVYNSSKSPLYAGMDTRYFPMGEDMFPVLLQELKKAERFIFMEYFIIEKGKFFDAILEVLTQKVKEGVEVRIMYDDLGCMGKLPMGYAAQLRKAGIHVRVFHPFLPVISAMHNNRDHRKITVIDNRVAFTGGINLADEYINQKVRFGTWKDAGILLKGDIVQSCTLLFLSLWNLYAVKKDQPEKYCSNLKLTSAMPEDTAQNQEHSPAKEKGYAIFFGDGPNPFDGQQVGKNIYLNILNSATDYVYITTPYLVCDNELLSALRLTAQRGVDVRLITPFIPDKRLIQLITRSHYASLIEAGVKIYEYTPGFIHAKNFVSDDKFATVSTINLDYRSLTHHFECGVWLYKTPTVAKVKEDFNKTFAQCTQITLQKARLNPIQRLLKSVLQLIAPLL